MIGRLYLDDAIRQLRKLKSQADQAIAQVDGASFFAVLDPESNSIAIIAQHLAGNMRSRWTDFLTSDGEKPDRDRDSEFETASDATRDAVLARWEDGWNRLFDALRSLTPEDLERTVRVRGEALSAIAAINRQIVHYSSHVGQIVLLAKHYAGPEWKTLSIPRGGSRQFNASKM